MSDYVPDYWQIVRIVASGSNTPVFKVFAAWSGSYLYGESWKLNSGIEKVEDKEDAYDVHGASGSVYTLRKGREGMSGYGQGVLTRLRGQIEASGGIVEQVSIPEVQEFLKQQSCCETSEPYSGENTTQENKENP